ncbi:MAG: hypothetical protein ACRC6T_17305 [Sarcina sp.]
MNKLKEMIIRKGFNFKVIEVSIGKAEVSFETALKLKDEYSEYFYLLDEVPGIIKGIKKVEVELKIKKATISFNNNILDIKDIENLLLDIKEFIIEEWDFVSEAKEEETQKVIMTLKNKFKERISKK